MSPSRARETTLLDAYELRLRTSPTGLLVPAHPLHVRPRVPTLVEDFLSGPDLSGPEESELALTDDDIIESRPLDPRVMESGIRSCRWELRSEHWSLLGRARCSHPILEGLGDDQEIMQAAADDGRARRAVPRA